MKMLNFNRAVNLYKNDKIRELAETDEGMRFLKLRSLSRKEYLDYLIRTFKLKVGDLKSTEWLEFIYQSAIQSEDMDNIMKIYVVFSCCLCPFFSYSVVPRRIRCVRRTIA